MSALELQTQAGARIPLRRAISIGAGPEADLLVAAAGVAPLHARVEPVEGGWIVRSLGGAVGIGAAATEEASIRPGDRIRIGATYLHVARRRRCCAKRLAMGAAALLVAAAAALVAQRAHPDEAAAQVELVAGGQAIRWRGEGAALDLLLEVADPARTFVELEIEAPAAPAVIVEVEGGVVGHLLAGPRRRIALGDRLRPGENRVRIRTAGGAPLGALELRAEATPVPDCSAGTCGAQLEAALERAERLERARDAAPANLYEAWRWLRRARGYALGSGSAADAGQVAARLAAVEAELDRRCAAFEFAGARHLALADRAGAREVARRILRAFPGGAHGCRASGERLLALVEGGR